jgi:polyisoprenoid-binding protein YceI
MKKIIKHAVILFSAFFILSHAHAAAPEWRLDFDHTGFFFSINHIYSVVRGHFDEYKGTVVFSPDDLANSRFDFEVEINSIDTNNSKRDRHLNSADFFDSKKYPTMTFKSRAVKHVKGNQYAVEGTLTMKDVSKEISVPFTFFGKKDFPFDKKLEVAGFEARMTLDRLAYNVGSGKYVDMGVVGQEVEVLISMEVLREK